MLRNRQNDECKALVSVVIPAFNAGKYIAKAIDSVLEQTYKNLEVIIINDGSTDNTLDIATTYKKRINIYSQENAGLSEARNAGIKRAKGEFIAFLDADDYWMPGKVESQVKLLVDCPDIGFCSTATKVENEKGEISIWACPKESGSMLCTIFSRNASIPGSGSGVMVRSRILNEVGFFDPDLKSLEDIDMWMRLAAITKYRCIDEPGTVIFKSSDSMSGNLKVMRRSAIQVMKKNRNLLPPKHRDGFWRYSYAGVLADYAKWECRLGRRFKAILHLFHALIISPLGRGRLIVGLMLGILMGKIH